MLLLFPITLRPQIVRNFQPVFQQSADFQWQYAVLCEDGTGCGIAPQCKSDNKEFRTGYQEYYIIYEQKHKQTILKRNITYSVNTEDSTQPASRKSGAEKGRIKLNITYIASRTLLKAIYFFKTERVTPSCHPSLHSSHTVLITLLQT